MIRAVILAVFAIVVLSVVAHPGRSRTTLPVAFDARTAAPGEVLVQLSPATLRFPDATLERRLGGKIVARLPEIGFVRLSLDRGETVAHAVGRLSDTAGVTLAEPNLRVHAAMVPNDALYSGQSPYLSLIEAPAAWDIEQGRASVIVAVLDSGIDLDHEDLQGKVWTNVNEIPGNGADDDRNGCVDDIHGCGFLSAASADPSCAPRAQNSIIDDAGHGTFVAGIIAAHANNGIGISGAAPGVTILPVKILDCLGGGTAADAAQGLLYAARAGARVANISFGADGESATLANAIRQAYYGYGMVIVAATGNEGGSTVSFPARLPEAIAVASSGTPSDTRTRSPFSDWGPQVAVAAPGLNIISTVPPAFCGNGWFCVQGQPYALASGTSFAAPFVSALAALIISHNPNITPEAVLKIMRDTAEPLPDAGTPGWAGAGRIRMRAALNVPRYFLGTPGLVRQ